MHHISYHILYYKAAAVYILYPLILLLMLYLTGARHKLFLAIPQLMVTVPALADLSEVTGFFYQYRENCSYVSGPFYWIPFWVEGIYLLLLVVQSVQALRDGNKAFGTIVAFVADL